MKKVTILIVAMVALTFMIQWQLRKKNTEMMATIEEIESDRIRWNEKKMDASRQQAEQHYAKARELLAPGKLLDSYRDFAKGRSAMSPYVDGYGDRMASPGVTISDWFTRQEKLYRDALIPAFAEDLELLKVGDVSYPYVKQAANWFDHKGIPELKASLDENFKAISAIRARNAPTWIRINLPYSEDTYNELLRNLIKDKFVESYGMKIVYGYAMDHAEKQATWKTVGIQKEQSYAYYETTETRSVHTPAPQVPERLQLSIETSGTKEVPTSWDSIAKLDVTVNVPATIMLRLKSSDGGENARNAVHDAEVGLLEKMTGQLNALPPFTIFPGVDLESASVITDNSINMDVARMISFTDRPKLIAALTSVGNSSDPSLRKQFAVLCISQNISEKAEQVAQILPTLQRRDLDEALRELVKKPWYGGYLPLIALMDRLPHDNSSSYITRLLDKQLGHQPLKDALLRRLAAVPEHMKGNYIGVYMRNVDADEAEKYARVWLKKGSAGFASQVFNQYRNNHGKPAYSVALELYVVMPERVLQWITEGRGFRPSEHESGWQIIRDALNKPDYQQWALQLAVQSCSETEAWDIVAALVSVTPPWISSTANAQNRLVYGVRQAHPDNAFDYLMKVMKETDNEGLRDSAVSQLFAGDENKTRACQAVVQVLSDRENHRVFVPQVLNAISRYKSSKKGWDFGAANHYLSAIMVSATKHESEQCRKSAYSLLGYFIRQGHANHRETLEQAIAAEPLPELKQAAQKYLK